MNELKTVEAQLKEDEGYSSKPYLCPAGKLSIGWGRNLEANGIRKDEAELMLKNDINEAIEGLVKADKGKVSFFIKQPKAIQEVLINMAYNMGVKGLLTFKLTLGLITERKYTAAAGEMLRSDWADQVGIRANRLSEIVFECMPDAPNGNLHKIKEDETPDGKVLVDSAYLNGLKETSRLAKVVLEKTNELLKTVQDE